MVAALFFYLFASVAIASAVMVISSRNPVHSVLFLILCFFNAAGLFILLGAEFLAMILVVVYVGAVAVLFLFVVMMLDVDFVQLRQGMLNYLPVGGTIGLIVLVELALDMARQVLAPGGTFVTKLFHGEGFDQVFAQAKDSFQKVLTRKPKASRARSSEVYLVARAFRGG